MKRTLLAAALCVALIDTVSAQSSVSLYGTVNLGVQSITNSGTSRRLSMEQDGLNSTQLVFAGREDLGSGAYAGFLLNSGFQPETGTSNAKFFNRGSYLTLGGDFGEVRLGRDYVPTFYPYTQFDVFGAVGIGASVQDAQIAASALGEAGNKVVGVTAAYGATVQRADNSVTYILPKMGGLYGEAMVAAGQGSTANPGRYVGGRLGYAQGPVDVVGAYGVQNFSLLTGTPKLKIGNVAAKVNFGVARIMGYVDQQEIDLATGANLKETRESISGAIPVGLGEIHLAYNRSKVSNSKLNNSNTISMESVGFVYNVSKRTAVYSAYAHLANGALSVNSLAVGSMEAAAPTYGGTSTGFEFGVRHFF